MDCEFGQLAVLTLQNMDYEQYYDIVITPAIFRKMSKFPQFMLVHFFSKNLHFYLKFFRLSRLLN